MKKLLVTILSIVILVSILTVGASATDTPAPFLDVESYDWFYDAVTYVYDNGLMNGTTDIYFTPNVPTTRGMIATILYRMEGSPDFTGNMPFTDVSADSYCATAIGWAQANGIVTGCTNASYKPEENITRKDLATILYRYANYRKLDVSVGENTNILSYNDVFEIPEYAIPAIQWVCGAGLMEGNPDGYWVPQGLVSRAEVATICMGLLENT